MKNIRSIWDKTVQDFADLTAVKWLENKEIKERTYKKLGDRVLNVRQGLEAEGFRGSHIALIGTSSVEWIESYLGIVTGVNIAVPLDALLPEAELIELLQRSDSEAVFISTKLIGMVSSIMSECPKIRRVWVLTEKETGFDILKTNESLRKVDATERKLYTVKELLSIGERKADVAGAASFEIATIIYTSGTTGKSKGVMLTQENLAENIDSVEYDAQPGCVVLSVLPIHHAYCLVMDWMKTFSLGATVCINDSFMHMVKNMGIFKPEVMLMVPLMIETIYKKIQGATPEMVKKVLGGNLRIIFTGGAHLEPYYIDKFKEFGVDILEGYGMSECSPVISSNNPNNNKPGSIGKPLKNVEIRIEDGEILVRGTSVMKGYYKMPKETSETLTDGWLHTGDKGYLDEDGYLFINGRVKNLIILSNGENVSPEEIENKLSLCPLISEVIITGENNGLTARIFPEKELADAKKMSDEDVRKELQEYIDSYNKTQPSYRHITALVVRSTPFIRNTTGKIKRQEVEKENPAA